MPKPVPRDWAQDSLINPVLPNTPAGEVVIKSEVTYNGNKYAVVTNSKGEYSLYLGGTGITNQQIGSNALLFSSDASGNISPGIAWSRPDSKTQIGGNAGFVELKNKATLQVKEGLAKYLTETEINSLQNPQLKNSITGAQPPAAIPEVGAGAELPQDAYELEFVDPTDTSLFDVSVQSFNSGSPFNSAFLKYPENMNSSQDRITITQRRYRVSNKDLSDRFASQATTEETIGMAVLPMPNNITESNVTGWGENSLSTLTAMVMGASVKAANKIGQGNLAGLFFDEPNQESSLTEAKDILQSASGRMKTALTLNAAASITKFLGLNVDPEAFRSRATGTVINPNLELLFNGPKLRSFGFEFKMSPRSKEEAKHIRYIIKFFKKGMAPVRKLKDATGTDSAGFYLGAPNVFDIQFKAGNNSQMQSIGKIKTCALQQCNVNYTPDGFYAAYQDSLVTSQPISVTMQLAFTELTPMYNDDYSQDENIIN